MDILILVCALSIAAPDCQENTAIHVFQAPPAGDSMIGCVRQGLLFAAESHLVKPGNYAKVICRNGGPVTNMAKIPKRIGNGPHPQ